MMSLIGTWMQSVAQAWLVYRMTKSPFCWVRRIRQPDSGLPGGADRRHHGGPHESPAPRDCHPDRVHDSGGILAWLTLSGRVQVWHIFVLAGLLGVVNAFDIPGRQSFLIDMVGKGDLMNAIALNSSMFNAARVIGPAVAGILVARIGEGWCFPRTRSAISR